MKLYTFIIFVCAVVLVLFGSMLVLSASSTFSSMKFDNPQFLFNGHIAKALIGIFLMGALAMFDYHHFKKFSKFFMFLGLILLASTFVFAPEIKGSQRSISIAGYSFQPVELVKIALFIHLAALLERIGDDIKDWRVGLKVPMIWILLISGLTFLQPNVSNGVLILVTGIAILFVAGMQLKHFFTLAGAGASLAILVAIAQPHSLKRIQIHLASIFSDGPLYPQVQQSLYGMGSGGIFGVGLGHSAQRNLFLPEAYGDFIFAVVGEESGLLGTFIVLLLYGAILVCGLIIAKNAKDKFGKILAFAISFSIAIYAFVNAAVATGVLPVTGLPLPLISHGGTAIIIVCSSIGILLNIGLSVKKQEESTKEPKEVKTWQEQTVSG